MEQAVKLANKWGWDNPSEKILTLAAHAVAIDGDVERALLRLELVDAPTMERLRDRVRVDGTDLLEAAVTESPARVQPYTEMVRALCQQLPFYEHLDVLTQHSAMTDPQVVRQCEEQDCALMLIEGTRPVIVFSTLRAMVNYKIQGRADKSSDALLQKAGTEAPQLAVGSRDDISAIVSQAGGTKDGEAGQSANVWHSASQETKQQPAQRELARLLDHAIDNEASDIALIPQRDHSYRIKIRRWGSLLSPRTATTWSPAMASAIIEVLQSKSGANPQNTSYRTPRDGQISYKSPVGDAFLRLSFVPLNHMGEIKTKPSVSIRLFSHSESKISLDGLGLPVEVVQAMDDAVRMPQGMILVVGPMNSGKSTTVAAGLGRHIDLFGETKKRISVEDPIERFIAGVTQVQVPTVMLSSSGERVSDSGRWDEIMRGLKRHDGNTFWIGEVRDTDTATFCATTAGSGHLAFSTIHAKDSVLGFDVLSTMVKEELRFQLAECMSLVISQRLVPKLCSKCSVAAEPTAEERRQWASYMAMVGEAESLPAQLKRSRPHSETGCPDCQDGHSGYAPVCEVLPFTREVRDAATALQARGAGAVDARKRMSAGRTLTLVQCVARHLEAGDVELASVLYL